MLCQTFVCPQSVQSVSVLWVQPNRRSLSLAHTEMPAKTMKGVCVSDSGLVIAPLASPPVQSEPLDSHLYTCGFRLVQM